MFRKRTKAPRRALLLGATVAAGLAATSIALATIPDAGGVIHGCYRKSSPNQGTLRVIDTEAGQSCLPTEAQLTWNQTGPPGPQGLQGPQGEQGPPGPAGTPATVLWAVIDDDGTVLSGKGVQSVEHEAGGSYRVTFDTTVQWCAAFVTPWYAPIKTAATDVALKPNTKDIDIGEPGNFVDWRFQVAVFC